MPLPPTPRPCHRRLGGDVLEPELGERVDGVQYLFEKGALAVAFQPEQIGELLNTFEKDWPDFAKVLPIILRGNTAQNNAAIMHQLGSVLVRRRYAFAFTQSLSPGSSSRWRQSYWRWCRRYPPSLHPQPAHALAGLEYTGGRHRNALDEIRSAASRPAGRNGTTRSATPRATIGAAWRARRRWLRVSALRPTSSTSVSGSLGRA